MTEFKDLHAERVLLANILQNPDMLIDLDNQIYLTAFKNPKNKVIFSIAMDLYNEGYRKLEQELIYKHLGTYVDHQELADLNSYVGTLMGAPINPENTEQYIRSLRDVYMKTEIEKILELSTIDLQKKKATEIVAALQSRLFQIDSSTGRKEEDGNIGRGIKDYFLEQLKNPERNYGIPCGIELIDQRTLGWLKTKFYFVAARPKCGKSAFLLQSAVNAAYYAPYNRSRVLVLDTEIPKNEFRQRLLAHIAGIPLNYAMTGAWAQDSQMYQNGMQALDMMEQNDSMLYHEYIPGFRISTVVNLIKKYVYNFGVELVVFDYIKEPQGGDKARWQKVGDLARTLKDLAGELDISTLSALQQNRKGEGESRNNATAYAESDDVLKECDVAFMLNKKTPKEVKEETKDAGTHIFQIERGRYVGSLYNGINLRFLGYCLRFMPAKIQTIYSHVEQGEEDAIEQTPESVPELFVQ